MKTTTTAPLHALTVAILLVAVPAAVQGAAPYTAPSGDLNQDGSVDALDVQCKIVTYSQLFLAGTPDADLCDDDAACVAEFGDGMACRAGFNAFKLCLPTCLHPSVSVGKAGAPACDDPQADDEDCKGRVPKRTADLNCDGVIDSVDFSFLVSVLMGKAGGPGTPDLDGDGRLNFCDDDSDADGDDDETDCGPLDPELYTGNLEVCDGIDNDCDDVVDLIDEPCASVCEAGVSLCVDGDWGPCSALEPQDCMNYATCAVESMCLPDCPATPAETCNGLDDDCANGADDPFTCVLGGGQAQDCGNCGSQSRTCTSQCDWSAWGTCTGQGVCAPGQLGSQSCGLCGTQSRICSDQCQWGTWGTCTGQGTCSPGQYQSQSCGNCGTQSRTCTASCSWGSWSTCSGQGVCSPGQTQTQGCGNCGTQSRSCTGSCYWGSWSSCNDPCACECSGGTCCSNGCDYDNYGTSCSACKKCNSSGSCSVNKSNGTSCSGGVCYNGVCKDCLPGAVDYCDPNCGAFSSSTDGYRECSGSGTWGSCKPVVCEPGSPTYYQAVPSDYSWHCKNSSVYPGMYLCVKTYTFWICGSPVIEFHLQKATGLGGSNSGPFDNNLKVTLRNVDKGKTTTISYVGCAGQETCYFTVGVSTILGTLGLTGTDSFEVDVTSPNSGGIYVGTTGKANLVKCY